MKIDKILLMLIFAGPDLFSGIAIPADRNAPGPPIPPSDIFYLHSKKFLTQQEKENCANDASDKGN
ncbi:MAG: hypothetical protein Kow0037_29220 [Calditrichia bacterium]